MCTVAPVCKPSCPNTPDPGSRYNRWTVADAPICTRSAGTIVGTDDAAHLIVPAPNFNVSGVDRQRAFMYTWHHVYVALGRNDQRLKIGCVIDDQINQYVEFALDLIPQQSGEDHLRRRLNRSGHRHAGRRSWCVDVSLRASAD